MKVVEFLGGGNLCSRANKVDFVDFAIDGKVVNADNLAAEMLDAYYGDDFGFASWASGAVGKWHKLLADRDGRYYAVAGDVNGVAYFMPVWGLAIQNGGETYDVSEDENTIYVNNRPYSKEDWTLGELLKG